MRALGINDIQSKIFCKTNRCQALPPLVFLYGCSNFYHAKTKEKAKRKNIFYFIFSQLQF